MTDQQTLTAKTTYLPDADPVKELREHLTPQQLFDLSKAMEFVRSQTGHGCVSIEFKGGHPRFIRTEISAELKP